jgi:diacylglycerol kinase (ATP)
MYDIIVNSASKKGLKAAKKISRELSRRKIEYEFHYTSYPKHAKVLAGELAAAGKKNIIGIGGDGTFHEIVNGIQNLSEVNLGFIPLGSGNDFAKTAKLPKNNLKKALKIILDGNIKKIDYIQFANGTRSLNAAGTGMDVDVLNKAYAFRRLKGFPNYLWALLRVLKNFEPYYLTVETDGQKKTYECMIVCVANGIFIGGGMKVSPFSDLSDGKLNLVVVHNVPRKLYRKYLPKFLTGKHIGLFAEQFLVDKVKVTSDKTMRAQLDGEIYNDFNFDCHVVKSGINMFSA